MQLLKLGYSPCPNDTFIFHALIHGRVGSAGLKFQERLEDVETLNRLVLTGKLDVSKISYHLLGHVRNDYVLLRSGGALGRGCGPLLVAAHPFSLNELQKKRIALPGMYTTAALLLKLFDPKLHELCYMPFDRIMGAVAEGTVDAGVIIHESRFTFHEQGLIQLLDLGEWWEKESGFPIPLGGIVASRRLGRETILSIDAALRSSVGYALSNPQSAREYTRSHSQEMSDDVCSAHIHLYVNDFSRDVGVEGEMAIAALLQRAETQGLIPPARASLFMS